MDNYTELLLMGLFDTKPVKNELSISFTTPVTEAFYRMFIKFNINSFVEDRQQLCTVLRDIMLNFKYVPIGLGGFSLFNFENESHTVPNVEGSWWCLYKYKNISVYYLRRSDGKVHISMDFKKVADIESLVKHIAENLYNQVNNGTPQIKL